jgi:hypothetical protein
MIFFSNSGVKIKNKMSRTEKDKETEKVQELIKRLEKENPEMVSKIRSQFNADRKLKSVKESGQDEIGSVVKHWISDNGNE